MGLIRVIVAPCSLGEVLVAATTRGVCAVFLGDASAPLLEELARRFPVADIVDGDTALGSFVARIVEQIEAPTPICDVPIDVSGTPFQEQVWDALLKIAPGTTASYQEIAQAIGAPRAVRAVAHACGANKVSVLIPCHRVVRKDGNLGGYHWGIERKRALLSREKESLS